MKNLDLGYSTKVEYDRSKPMTETVKAVGEMFVTGAKFGVDTLKLGRNVVQTLDLALETNKYEQLEDTRKAKTMYLKNSIIELQDLAQAEADYAKAIAALK